MKTYFGFALGDSMFSGACTIRRRSISIEEVRAVVASGVESCCNPSHKPTIDAMRAKYGIDAPIPADPPCVSLELGDRIIVMGVRGLPRRQDRHEYTPEEIAGASFAFSEYLVVVA